MRNGREDRKRAPTSAQKGSNRRSACMTISTCLATNANIFIVNSTSARRTRRTNSYLAEREDLFRLPPVKTGAWGLQWSLLQSPF